MDSKSRSIIKAITWAILALFITIIVCFAMLGSWSVSLAIGILSALLENLFTIFMKDFAGKTSLI